MLHVAERAPDVIWILLNDAGFGSSGTFAGGARTPVLDSLAQNGLRYTNLTGRNHHAVGIGMLPQKLMAAEFPGYTGQLQPKDGTITHYMRARGYSTYTLGKGHLTPDDESTDLGLFDRWPSGLGFDHFLGFLGGAVDQYKPPLVEDNQFVKPAGRHGRDLPRWLEGELRLSPRLHRPLHDLPASADRAEQSGPESLGTLQSGRRSDRVE